MSSSNRPTPPDAWDSGGAYERYMGRWSRQLAPRFLDWLGCPPGLRWLDVGCGTGALSAAIVERCAPARVTAVEPSAGYAHKARQNLAREVGVLQATAERLPIASDIVDVVVSSLVLNFIPDPRAALAEMVRAARPGGTISATVWDYAGKMEFLRHFWDAAAALDPLAARLDEGPRFPLCHPETLAELFTAAGLQEVATAAVDAPTVFASFEDFWQPFLGGQGPAPGYTAALDDAARERLRESLRERLPAQAGGAIPLTARAWAVRGRV